MQTKPDGDDASCGTEVSAIGRRGFLKKGLLGTAVLLAAATVPIAFRSTLKLYSPQGPLRLLSEEEYAILAAAAARIVPGPGAGATWPSAAVVDCAGKIDALLAKAHPATGTELRQLLHLLENGLTGFVLTLVPKPFTRCSAEQQVARLNAWRTSRLGLLRSSYRGLVRLVEGAYYAAPEVQALTGYPGPPKLARLGGRG